MKLKDGVTLAGLNLLMRPVLKTAELIWKDYGIEDGVTITCCRDGAHSAGSWHYYGLALDLRTHYFEDAQKDEVHRDMVNALVGYDVINHSTHIHVEPGNTLLRKEGYL